MNRTAWRGFRKLMGIDKCDAQVGITDLQFFLKLKPKEYYPRVHFICEYGGKGTGLKGTAKIDMHLDIFPHIAPKRRFEILDKLDELMKDYNEIHRKIIELKLSIGK